MSSEWKNWCRLCGCKNNSDIDVFIKDEIFFSLSEAIQRFLSITICDVDEAPKKICQKCQTLISEFVTFSMKVTKVQEMYSELQFNDKYKMITNFETLRRKYALSLEQEENFANPRNSDRHSFDEEEYQEQPSKRKRRKRSAKTITKLEENYLSDDEKLKVTNENDEKEKSVLDESFDSVNQEINVNVEIKEEESFESSTSKKSKRKREVKSETHPKKIEIFCEVCNKGCANQGCYTIHLKRIHKIIKQPATYPCKTCGKVYKKSSHLKSHENTHLPPDQKKLYPCPHCDKKFTAGTSIAGHIRTVHIKERSFVCEECGKAFSNSGNLANHKIVHSNETPFQCSICLKRFKCARFLKRHIELHEDTKYTCPICATQFKSKQVLRGHMIIHSDERKYKCNFCYKGFKRATDFKNHLILHTGIKPYQCQFCDQTFANGSNCRKHKKTAHPQELAEAEEAGTIHITRNIPSTELLKAVNEEALLNNNSR